MIDDIVIELWSFWNFASMEDIRRKCNPIVKIRIKKKKKHSGLRSLLKLY